jgi:hypothetical protein
MPFPRLTFLKQAVSKGAKRYLYLALSWTVNKQKAMQKESVCWYDVQENKDSL